MNKISTVVFGLVGLGVMTIAGCASEYEVEEESGTTESTLSRSCLKKIDAKPGTEAWLVAVKECVDAPDDDATSDDGKPDPTPGSDPPGSGKPSGDAGAGAPDASKPGSDAGAAPDDKPAGGNGNVAVHCVNGACKCAAGPQAGKSCDGTTKTGPNACSVVCRY